MARRLVVQRQSDLDIQAAALWYEDQRPGLGIRFLGELDPADLVGRQCEDRIQIELADLRNFFKCDNVTMERREILREDLNEDACETEAPGEIAPSASARRVVAYSVLKNAARSVI